MLQVSALEVRDPLELEGLGAWECTHAPCAPCSQHAMVAEYRRILGAALDKGLDAGAVLNACEEARLWWDERASAAPRSQIASRIELGVEGPNVPVECKGILLLGGSGRRLESLTHYANKHLLPVYDRPSAFFALNNLLLAGVRDIAVVTTPEDYGLYAELLGDGSRYGVSLAYLVQDAPDGISRAMLLAREFADGRRVAVSLGDNAYYKPGLQRDLQLAAGSGAGMTIFAAPTDDPFHFCVLEFNREGRAVGLEFKPEIPASPWVITGLFFLENQAFDMVAGVAPDRCGEHQIFPVLESYFRSKRFEVYRHDAAVRWFDVGREETLFAASLQAWRDTAPGGCRIPYPEETALALGNIDVRRLEQRIAELPNGAYRRQLRRAADAY
jgi:glucose-1-phosphate thymidylyltransferase